jgi:hypothetical protein
LNEIPIAKSRSPFAAIFTAAKCSATLPTIGTMIRPMKMGEMPVDSMVGSMALTRNSERNPVTTAEMTSTSSDRRGVQRAVPSDAPDSSGERNAWKRYAA